MMSMSTVLLVDDDDSLRLLLEHAIKQCGLPIELHSVGDGAEAVQYLARNGGSEFPSLVLLDLKMPRMNGFEVLKWKRTQPQLESMPVIVWSSSCLEEDKEQALQLGAASYFVKPMETTGFVELLKALESYAHITGVRS